MNAYRPARRDELVIGHVDDEFLVYDPVSDRTTLLNWSAAAVLELCDGERTVAQIIAEMERVVAAPAGDLGTEIETVVRSLATKGLFADAPSLSRAPDKLERQHRSRAVICYLDESASLSYIDAEKTDLVAFGPGAALQQFPNHLQSVFTKIYETNAFRGEESVSGPGANLQQTFGVRRWIPQILEQLKCSSMLDIPCGDFNWMKEVLPGLREKNVLYIGADIVRDLIEKNIATYEKANFVELDLCSSSLPCVDLVFCRDCLGHLSTSSVRRAVANLKKSGSTWLVATTFQKYRPIPEIDDGSWRPVNLCLPPFSWPIPDHLFAEGCTEGGGQFLDKSLGVWRIAELP